MIFAKLQNNKPVFCPRNGYANGVAISNLNIFFENNLDIAFKEGWKIYVPLEEPIDNIVYTETEKYIYEVIKD